MSIHSKALVHPEAVVPDSCTIGPFSIIDKGSVLGDKVVVGARCHVYPMVKIGSGTQIFDGAILGSDPQDKKFEGEETWLMVGEQNVIREYVTINRGTRARGKTEIGSQCLIMAYSHIAHDCILGDSIIMANGVQMGGHVEIGDHAVISGMTGIHQFTKIGQGSFIGGGLRVTKDIFPFSKALGEPLNFAGVNEIGLEKIGQGKDVVRGLKKIFREIRLQGISCFDSVLDKAQHQGELAKVIDVLKKFRNERGHSVLI